MTKIKKMLSLGLAGCMAVSSLMMAASAAEVSDADTQPVIAPLSEHAGQETKGVVVYVQADGTSTEKEYTVDIPADATEAEASVLAYEEAAKAVSLDSGDISPLSIDIPYYNKKVATKSNLLISPATSGVKGGTVVSDIYLDGNWNIYGLEFVRNGPYNGSVSVRVENETQFPSSNDPNRNIYQTVKMNADYTWGVVFYDMVKYPNLYFRMNDGDHLVAYASLPAGTTTSCRMNVHTYVGQHM